MPLQAAPPEESRPYLELPFPGGTSYRVTCGYECYQHKRSMSYAVDLAIPEGHPIVAAAGGEVMAITWETGLPASLNLGDALIVYIDHGEGWFTRYVHLDGITVRVGDQVKMGDVIGYSGKTGASGDHLHFELKYGSSLHSPSVPINELFEGEAPKVGSYYTSNNLPLAVQIATPASPTVARATTTLLPTSTPTFSEPLVVEQALALSESQLAAGQAVTATFTIRNRSNSRLSLAMLGIGGRVKGAESQEAQLFFDRTLILNPGRSYRFSQSLRFDTAGEVELFLFAFDGNNEWLALAGEGQQASLRVSPGHRLFFPFLR